jgi:hypothetical protein
VAGVPMLGKYLYAVVEPVQLAESLVALLLA